MDGSRNRLTAGQVRLHDNGSSVEISHTAAAKSVHPNPTYLSCIETEIAADKGRNLAGIELEMLAEPWWITSTLFVRFDADASVSAIVARCKYTPCHGAIDLNLHKTRLA